MLTINLPEWVAYIGIILIALWAIDKILLFVKKWYECKLYKLENENNKKKIKQLQNKISGKP